jgi:hypothetical protein
MKGKAGRKRIYMGDGPAHRVQGGLTWEGARAFEYWRDMLAEAYKAIVGVDKAGGVSDADVIESLARGPVATLTTLLEVRAQRSE